MLQAIRFTKEGAMLPEQHSSYIDIKEFIDKHNLHNLEAVRAAYDLSKETTEGLLYALLVEGVTQEDIELLYRQGGLYLWGSIISDGTKSFASIVVETELGLFKNSEGLPMLNRWEKQGILLHVSACREYSDKGSGNLVTVINGYYMPRKPFSCKLQGVFDKKSTDLCEAYSKHMVEYINGNIQVRTSDLLFDFIGKECAEILQKGSGYKEFLLEGYLFISFESSLAQPLLDVWEKEGLNSYSLYVYVSIHEITGVATLYV